MKFETTKKAIMNNYNGYCYSIQVPYADLQNMLNCIDPIAATHGIYGLNADIYDMRYISGYDSCIVTGYRPFGNIKPTHEFIKAYEKKAESIVHDSSIDYDSRKKLLNYLIVDFVVNAIEEYRNH